MVRKMRSAGNGAATTLNGAVNDSTTTWVVNDGSVFPAEGDYYVARGSEIALVTHRSTNTLTVVRGQAGTLADSWGDGASVVSIVTQEEFEARRNERGRIKCVEYGKLVDSSGNILTASDFTSQGNDTCIISDGNDGTINIDIPSNTSSGRICGARKTLSSGVDIDIIVRVGCGSCYTGTSQRFGLFYRADSGGNMRGISVNPISPGSWVTAGNWGTWLANTYSSEDANHDVKGLNEIFFRVAVDWDNPGSTDNFTWSYSLDGVHWFEMYTHSFAAGTGTIGVWGNNGRTTTSWDRATRVHLLSWYEELL